MTPGRWASALGVAALLLPWRGSASARACEPSTTEAAWMQRALATWERATTDFLRLPLRPLPTIVLFSPACTWYLAAKGGTGMHPLPGALRFGGAAVPLWGAANGGTIRLPTGDSFPLSPRVYAAISPRLARPFLVLALPSVFRLDSAAAADSLLDERLLGVMSHELLHTIQLPGLSRQIDALRGHDSLPAALDDNVVERSFGGDSAFRRAFAAERDRLFAAVFAADSSLARLEAERGLALLERRRATYFVGTWKPYGRLEDLFLNLEGSAEWLRFKVHQAGSVPWGSDRAIVAFMRGPDNDWVQDEGLALYLLLDRFAPGWEARLLGPELSSPVHALEAALRRRG